MMIDYTPVVLQERRLSSRADDATRQLESRRSSIALGEFFALPIFTCAGLMYLVSAIDFIFIFVALELVTISFYVLVSFTRRNPLTLEAGVKYLVLSALSTGFLVYGITWIFGATGETNLQRITGALANPAIGTKRGAVRHGAGAGRARVQDRRRSLSNLGAGCLSRRTHAGDSVSLRRIESRRLRRSAACLQPF